MDTTARRRIAGVLLSLTIAAAVAVATVPASAAPQPAAADPMFPFNYSIVATTHIQKLNQTITVPPGTFTGAIDLATGGLTGTITLPPAQFTFKLVGVVPLVTATAQIVPTQPVTGHVDLSTFKVTATSTFNLRILKAYAATLPLLPKINLVGSSCTTATPVRVTMSGTAQLGAASTFSGTFTLPPFTTCGLATTGLNLLIPGPGNTFSATATPR